MKTNVAFLLFLLAIVSCGSNKNSNLCQNVNGSMTIINYGNLNRDEIAQLIRKLQSLNPAVIGLSVFFINEKQGDDDLKELIAADNVVLPVTISGDGIKKSYFKNQNIGASDLIINEETNRVDEFLIYENFRQDTIKSFSVKILEKYSSDFKIDYNNPKYNAIDYNGNCLCFLGGDYTDIDSINPEVVEGKIILLGYLGSRNSFECVSDDIDVFNSNFNGGEKMYGTIISANVIYTLMKEHNIK